MSEIHSSSQESSEPVVMHTADAVRDQCSSLLWEIAPQPYGEKLEAWLARVCRLTGLSHSQAKRIRYREMNAVPAHVADLLRDVAAQQKAARERANAQRTLNDHLLAQARAGERLDSVSIPRSSDLADEEGDFADPRQIELPLHGWMKR